MKPIYPIVYACFAVSAIVRSVKEIIERKTTSVQTQASFFALVDTVPKYYIGLTIPAIERPTGRTIEVIYLWHETGVYTSKQGVLMMDYLKRQVPSLARRMVMRRASIFKKPLDPHIQMGDMVHTPGIDSAQLFMLKTIATILTAGKLLREHIKWRPTWDNY